MCMEAIVCSHFVNSKLRQDYQSCRNHLTVAGSSKDWAEAKLLWSHSSQVEGPTQMLSSNASASDCMVCMSPAIRPAGHAP